MRKDYMSVGPDESRDETRFIADHWAAIWRREGGPAKAIADVTRAEEYRAIAPILDGLPAGARVLDGGCGLGAWTAHMRARGFDALGLDIAAPTVAELNRLFGESIFRTADIRATGLADDSVDLYFSWGVFEHFEDGLQACLREAFRVLKPGATLAISVPFDNLRHALRAACAQPPPAPGAKLRFYQWRLTRAELARELAVAGFAVERLAPIGKLSGTQRALARAGRWAPRAAKLLAPVLPAGFVAHMLVGLARKPPAIGEGLAG